MGESDAMLNGELCAGGVTGQISPTDLQVRPCGRMPSVLVLPEMPPVLQAEYPFNAVCSFRGWTRMVQGKADD